MGAGQRNKMIEAMKHKLWRPLIMVLFSAVLLTACGTTYIEIQRPEIIREFGSPKFSVTPGDVLKVTRTKNCRTGEGVCWEVLNVKTGEIGYVFAEEMKKWHRVYSEGQ